MEKFALEKDITVVCVTASSFPNGIEEAFAKLRRAASGDRELFGISWPDRNGIVTYKAAAREEFPGEAEQLKLERFVIRRGILASKVIHDFMKTPARIGEVFSGLLQHPKLDHKGYCLEMYFNDNDVRCLVRLKD